KRILRRVCCAAAPPELTAMALYSWHIHLFLCHGLAPPGFSRKHDACASRSAQLFGSFASFYSCCESRWRIGQRGRAYQLNEDVGQGWLGQLETVDDAAVVQRGFHDQVGVEIGRELHFDVILPALGDLHARKLLKPARLGIVLECEPGHIAPGLSFDL